MQQEATEKLIGLQRHGSSLVAMGIVAPTEGDLAIDHSQEARVGDGDAVSITRKIGEDLLRSGKRSLGIDDPVTMGVGAQESGKSWGRLQRSQLASESELVLLKSSLESSQELSPEDHTEYFDGQKELSSTGNPAAMIGRESSSRDHTMQVGMSEQSLAPGMQNRHKADVGTQVFGISSDLEESLSCGAKQQVVNQDLILQGQRSEKVGQSEDDMIVGDGQQFGGAFF